MKKSIAAVLVLLTLSMNVFSNEGQHCVQAFKKAHKKRTVGVLSIGAVSGAGLFALASIPFLSLATIAPIAVIGSALGATAGSMTDYEISWVNHEEILSSYLNSADLTETSNSYNSLLTESIENEGPLTQKFFQEKVNELNKTKFTMPSLRATVYRSILQSSSEDKVTRKELRKHTDEIKSFEFDRSVAAKLITGMESGKYCPNGKAMHPKKVAQDIAAQILKEKK